jgi:hypothetical protein
MYYYGKNSTGSSFKPLAFGGLYDKSLGYSSLLNLYEISEVDQPGSVSLL